MNSCPDIRIRSVNGASVEAAGSYVLYWMTAYRRTTWNFALDRAVDWARRLGKPLVVFEPLRIGYPWASDRLHQFIVQGMADNARAMSRSSAHYYPYVELQHGQGKGLLAALARRACVVVSDDFPCFFLPKMIASAAGQVPVAFELVDSNGLLPLRAATKIFARAFDFRRFLAKQLPVHLSQVPKAHPLSRAKLPRLSGLDRELTRRWPAADVEQFVKQPRELARLPINHDVLPTTTNGGHRAAQRALREFVTGRLSRYEDDRNGPEPHATSGLSPYLHFGHISAHEIFEKIAKHRAWSIDKIRAGARGGSKDWWGAGEAAEAFLDQLVTWRELGFNMCANFEDFDRYESLPDWARSTLREHAADPREPVYSLEAFEAAATHDPLWNAAQRQLLREGRVHNYLRMLWGKKILHWSKAPQEALAIMIELNNKYALDGRDPNSYSGIFWCLGRYDRAWGPERPIFGKVRYMSSANTARKLRVWKYLEEYGE